jgi:hypothetical protein
VIDRFAASICDAKPTAEAEMGIRGRSKAVVNVETGKVVADRRLASDLEGQIGVAPFQRPRAAHRAPGSTVSPVVGWRA